MNEKSSTKNIADYIAVAKANPCNITCGSAEPATNPHMLGELHGMLAGVLLCHIAYKGLNPAQLDLMGVAIDSRLDALSSVVSVIKANGCRAGVQLGVHTFKRLLRDVSDRHRCR